MHLRVGELIDILSIAATAITIVFYLYNAYNYRRYKAPKRIMSRAHPEKVTIVMPVYKESRETFSASIASAAAQGSKLIVIGEGDDAFYGSYVSGKGGKFIPFKGTAREAFSEAMKYVHTEYVMKLDTDTVLPVDAVKKMLSIMDKDVGGVGANIFISLNESIVSHCAELFERTKELVFRSLSASGNTVIIDGRGALFRTEVIKPLLVSNEFRNATFMGRKRKLGDDAQKVSYLVKKGYKVIIDYDVKAVTKAPQTFKIFTDQLIRWSRSSYMAVFEDLRDGILLKKGRLYVFNMVYTYFITILIGMLFLSNLYISISHHHPLLGTYSLLLRALMSTRFNAFTTLLLYLTSVRVLSFIAGTIFTLAVFTLVSRPRKKIAYSSILAVAIVPAASVYGAFTFWVQDKWMTR